MMGKKILLGMMIVAALLIMAQPSVSNAAIYEGAWTSNDNADWFAVKFTFGVPSAFSMYDWGNTGSTLEILPMGALFDSATVFFTQSNGNWFASLTDGGTTATDLNLGNDTLFGLFFGDGTQASHFSYDVQVDIPNEQYILTHPNFLGTIITTSDIQPVPIPASVLLLGSGMVGLIGFGKRMRKRPL